MGMPIHRATPAFHRHFPPKQLINFKSGVEFYTFVSPTTMKASQTLTAYNQDIN